MGPPAVSLYTTLPYSSPCPWPQVEWKKTVLEFDITAAKRVRISASIEMRIVTA
jgi:hypothetical protein